MTFLDGHDAVGKEFEAETQDLEGIEEVGALKILKRGLNASPELKAGVSLTALMALAVAGGKLLVPLTIKEVLDRGITTSGVNVSSVLFFSLIAMFLSIASMALGRATYYRLAKTAENVLMGLRVRTFEHLHKLSIADHVEARKGAYTARVTSDVETLTQFAQWGAIAWIINSNQSFPLLKVTEPGSIFGLLQDMYWMQQLRGMGEKLNGWKFLPDKKLTTKQVSGSPKKRLMYLMNI